MCGQLKHKKPVDRILCLLYSAYMEKEIKGVNWRKYLTPEEEKLVAYIYEAKADLSSDLNTIRNRCYQRARRSEK